MSTLDLLLAMMFKPDYTMGKIMSQRLLINNCRLFDAPEDEQTTSVLIENGIITQIGQIKSDLPCNVTLDAQGRMLAPGLIDVHIQGAGGADILDATPEALEAISRTCARFGTTSFLATTVFKPNQDNQHLALAAEYVNKDLGGANLLGIHLEGPFISLEKKGMILPECICPPSEHIFDEIQDITKGHLSMMTIAPEIPGNLGIIQSLVDSGIIASFGHSSATYEQTHEGFDAGISHVTHLFNAMSSIHHRKPGPLLAVFETESIIAQVITDGVHIHPAVLNFTYENLGPDRTIPITDGMQAIGLGDGMFIYNGVEYESKAGAARYKDGTLIGTALGLSQMLEKFISFTNCPLETAIRMATGNPARILGIKKNKGSIAIGNDADLVLLDDNLAVNTTIVAGKIVFRK
jgi:N-acetylglucosamine-6-phosphate deacetylase